MNWIIKRSWAWLLDRFDDYICWRDRKKPRLEPLDPSVVGSRLLDSYQAEYVEFQAQFLRRIRDKPDALFWKDFSGEDIGRIAGEWSYRKHWFI